MPKCAIPIERFLANLPLFSALEPDAIRRLTRGTAVLDVSRGAIIFRRGERCTGIHAVVYGQVKLALHSPGGEEKVLELLAAGHSCGEPPMFLDAAYLLTAEALMDSKVLHIASSVILEEIERDPRFARSVITALSRRLNRLISDVERYTLQTGTQRVSSYLLNCLVHIPRAEPPAVLFPAKKAIIASQLNLTQEPFSRILHDLATAGAIEVHGRAVRILDANRLRTISA
jgi:CRP/FNR family transcriptional regulator, dissimilatory nitrate respiration regulator